MGIIYTVKYGLFYRKRKSFVFYHNAMDFGATVRRFKMYENRGNGDEFCYKGKGRRVTGLFLIEHLFMEMHSSISQWIDRRAK